MAILDIRQFGDPVLRQASQPIEKIEKNHKGLAKNLAETMYAVKGLGLAAPQIGILEQLIVLDSSGEGKDLRSYINPEITWKSEETALEEEGCLSLREFRVPVARYKKIKFKAIDLTTGEEVIFDAQDWLARILQHEIDHLNGRIILERTSPEERKRVIKEIAFSSAIPRL